MLLIAPDFARTIDLPGVGPCVRPVDVDQTKTGFSNLVSLRIYSFRRGSTIAGEAEGDEVYVVLLSGAATFNITGAHDESFELSTERARAVYLPPDHAYRLTLAAHSEIAYARALPASPKTPQCFSAVGDTGALADPDYADKLHMYLQYIGAGVTTPIAAGKRETLAFFNSGFSLGNQSIPGWTTLALQENETAAIVPRSAGLLLTVSA